jgi:hypothetical protein
MKNKTAILAFATALLVSAPPVAADSHFGHFIGKFVADFGEDPRKVKLVEAYSFVDPDGKTWEVPAGYMTDGASVPAVLWALYPPFTGAYRFAAVIHDYYCDNKEETWQDTHKVFYNAMRAADVDETDAKLMYMAVYAFGPRWGPGTASGERSAAPRLSPKQQETMVEEMKQFVESENPDLDAIEAKARQLNRRAVAPMPETPKTSE